MRSLPTLVFLISLVLPIFTIAQSDCGYNPDYNGDNEIGVPDLLGLLSLFEEQDSDDDGIWDSQDDCIGIEDPCGVCNGTGTDADADGLCDDIDDCVGDYDECGVCNGPGPDVPVIENIVVFYDSTYIEAIDLWFVYEIGADTTFSYVCATPGCTDPEAGNFNPEAVTEDGSCGYGPEQCGGAWTVDFDGYTYDLVAIGDQCWFAENLRTEHYANGDTIPGLLGNTNWVMASFGAQAVYGEGTGCCDSFCDEVTSLSSYGRLYNWFAVDDPRGLCPVGWHVSNESDWTELLDYSGGLSTAAVSLKSSFSDLPPWDGSNASGFSALPGGVRAGFDGCYYAGGYNCRFWVAEASNYYGALTHGFSSNLEEVDQVFLEETFGFSVRCIKD